MKIGQIWEKLRIFLYLNFCIVCSIHLKLENFTTITMFFCVKALDILFSKIYYSQFKPMKITIRQVL